MATRITIKIDGADDSIKFLVRALHVSEGLSEQSDISVECLSERNDVAAKKLLGKATSVTMTLDSGERVFDGFLIRLSRGGTQGKFFSYYLTIAPGLWFLGRTSDCKVFQDITVPDLIAKLLKDDHPYVTLHTHVLNRQYRKWDYCVQYNETDLNFVRRLLEHEGIYYRFMRENGKATLRLDDDQTLHGDDAQLGTLKFLASGEKVTPGVIFISSWDETSGVEPGKRAAVHFDELVPKPSKSTVSIPQGFDHDNGEMFDYPMNYWVRADHDKFGVQYVTDRLQEDQTYLSASHGSTNSAKLAPGMLFTLARHPDPTQNIEYLLTSVTIDAEQSIAVGNQKFGSDEFSCQFTAIPSSNQFRPARKSQKPRILGPQTAFVTTEKGEEITVDEFGRIKIQFHWDRLGKNDDHSSCFVRVAQIWAGNAFGAVFIPRKGHEVIVSFLDGDPDRPVVTGSVYNGTNIPPWGDKATKTQSGIKTRSTQKGGEGNANFLRFEDKKGNEEFDLHAEKDMSQSIENDLSVSVGGNRSTGVSGTDDLNVTLHRTVTLKKGEDYVVQAEGRTMSISGKLGEVRVVSPDRLTAIDKSDTGFTKKKIDIAEVSYGFKTKDMLFDVGNSLGHLVGGGGHTMSSAGPVNIDASKFAFTTQGNVDFVGKAFNRTVFETNDIVLGPMTGTNLGPSSATQMGGSEVFVNGMAQSCYMGMSTSTAIALQIAGFIGASISNALSVSMSNSAISLGMTGLNLGMNGISLDNNSLKVYSGGGAGGSSAAGPSALGAGLGTNSALAVAGLGGAAAALGFGGLIAFKSFTDQKARAEKDKADQLATLTGPMQAALQKASQFGTVADFNKNNPVTPDVLRKQLDESKNKLLFGEDGLATNLQDADKKQKFDAAKGKAEAALKQQKDEAAKAEKDGKKALEKLPAEPADSSKPTQDDSFQP